MQQVMALTGGREIEMTANGEGVTVRWRRLYGEAESDERQLTVSGGWDEALAGILAWEAAADEVEADNEGEFNAVEFWRRLQARLDALGGVSGKAEGEQEGASVSPSLDLPEVRR